MSKNTWILVLALAVVLSMGIILGLWSPQPIKVQLTPDQMLGTTRVVVTDQRARLGLSPEWASALAAIAALVVAAVTLYVIVRDRNAPMRSEYYASRNEMLKRCTEAFSGLYYSDNYVIKATRRGEILSHEFLERRVAIVHQMNEARSMAFSFGEDDDIKRVIELARTQNAMSAAIGEWTRSKSEPANIAELYEAEGKALTDLINSVRSSLGHGKLAVEVAQLVRTTEK